jgi:hypothetical protein
MNGRYETSVADAESTSIEQRENRKFSGKGPGPKTLLRTVFYVDENPRL